MRIIVNGQQAFGKSVLDALVQRGEDVIAVYCPADKDGRVDPLTQSARDHDLPVYQPKSFKTDEVVEEFTDKGPTHDELERQKAKLEYVAMSRLQSILGKADALNRYQFFFGEPNSFKRDLDRYRNASAEDVRRWANRVLTPDARLILRVIPELKTPDDNPRDTQPTIADAKPFAPLTPATFKLNNGITVHHWERRELPLVQMTMLLPYGTTSDPAGRAGRRREARGTESGAACCMAGRRLSLFIRRKVTGGGRSRRGGR